MLAGCQGRESYGGKIFFSGEHHLGRIIAVDGNLLLLDALVVVDPEAAIKGPVYLLGDELRLGG